MAIKPLDNRVIVKQCEAEVKTAGGIVLPGSAQEKPQRGIVEFVGPGQMMDNGKRAELTVKKGDEVFYGKYAGSEVEIDGVKYVILRESDILAVIE